MPSTSAIALFALASLALAIVPGSAAGIRRIVTKDALGGVAAAAHR